MASRKGMGGPKPSIWRKEASVSFQNYFSARSSFGMGTAGGGDVGVPAPADQIEWSFSFGGDPDEETEMIGIADDACLNIVTGVRGRLVRKGSGSSPGVGTCHHAFFSA